MFGDYDPLADFTFVEERKPMPEKSMAPTKVRVTGPWQVQHQGNLFYEGQEATVPEHVAELWEQSKLVERVADKATPKKPTAKKESHGSP